jgi:hypothetical protein
MADATDKPTEPSAESTVGHSDPVGLAWPPGWILMNRDGDMWFTREGGCSLDLGLHEFGPIVPHPHATEVIKAYKLKDNSIYSGVTILWHHDPTRGYSKSDGSLTPEWILQQDIEALKQAVIRYCDHLEAFEKATRTVAEIRSDEGVNDG